MKYAYYPGCSLNSTGLEYNMSTKAVAKSLGVELVEIPEWNCCGASSAHLTDHLLALALPARNLALAEKDGLDVAIPCAACFARFKATEKAVRDSDKTQKTISEIIEMDYQAKNTTLSILDVFANKVGAQAVSALVSKKLSGLKAACYYGCLLVRPNKITEFDDPENPISMDNLMTAIGGETVNWSYKTECCGASHAVINPNVGRQMLRDIYRDAKLNGANCIITACPLCMSNLDMRQQEVASFAGDAAYDLPVFYFTELMGLALGYQPKELGIDKHFVDAIPLVNKLGQVQAGRDSA